METFWQTDDFFAVLADVDEMAVSHACLALQEREMAGRIANPNTRRAHIAACVLAKFLRACEEGNAGSLADFLEEKPAWASRLAVLTRTPEGKGMKPVLVEAGRTLPVQISLSHASGLAAAVMHRGELPPLLPGVGMDALPTIGCDLVPHGAVTAGMRKQFFTHRERQWLADSEMPHLAEKIWAGKEAAYKAAANPGHCGFAPAQFEVSADGVAGPDGSRFRLVTLYDAPVVFAAACAW